VTQVKVEEVRAETKAEVKAKAVKRVKAAKRRRADQVY